MSRASRWTGVALAAALAVSLARAQTTGLVSVATGGEQGNNDSGDFGVSVSADGRFVAFHSFASNLVAGDTNGYEDVFVHDRLSGTTERVSVATGGAQGNNKSGRWGLSISADGRFVAFASDASNLVAADGNGTMDVFVRDRQSGTTELVSRATGGAQGNSNSERPSISADGRFVAFESDAWNLVAGDTNSYGDVFVRDRQSGTTERVSVATGGTQGFGGSYQPSISADGRFVAFYSFDPDLVAGDTNNHDDIFVHDRLSGTTEMVSVATSGAQGNADSYFMPSISADGRFVAFYSVASNLVAGDTNGYADVFLRDRRNGTTELASLATGGAQGNNGSGSPSISADGRFVAFSSYASNLVVGDTNTFLDIFVRDRRSDTTERASVATSGAQGDGGSCCPSISPDRRYVAFTSSTSNLVAGDTNGWVDAFVRDRDASGFTSLCDPGLAGVIACPCSNPPNGSGRGCNNSAATGGAILSATGIAYLSLDSLVFTTRGEKPTATSIVLQGTTSPPAGLVFGQGVRCVGGSLKRLFVKSAVAGSITVPDFGAGDPTVSARSTAKGDVIQPGQSRWYLVYYRDAVVLGGCAASSTFNATQSGRIGWWP